MNIDGQISILISSEQTVIELRDKNAAITFLRLTLTPEQLSTALSRLMNVDCKINTVGLDKLGKKHENGKFEFDIPESVASSRCSETLFAIAQIKLKDTLNFDAADKWIPDSYFGSQDSFFTKGGVQYARCTIRRWI